MVNTDILFRNLPYCLLSCAFFFAISAVWKGFATECVPLYDQLSKHKKAQWQNRFLSTVHAVVVLVLSNYFLLTDDQLWTERVHHHTPAVSGLICFACGYFLWDTLECILHYDENGLAFLLHGITCFLCYSIGMIPLVQFYGLVFLMFEMSTPFLNIHWGMQALNVENKFFLYTNGVLLILTFFVVRIVFGMYWSFTFYKDAYHLLQGPQGSDLIVMGAMAYLGVANVLLNVLNLVWFRKIISFIWKKKKVD